MLDSAVELIDLRSPPGNRFEKLGGDRQGQYSIRINKQWRICFIWQAENAIEVEIVDYGTLPRTARKSKRVFDHRIDLFSESNGE